MLQGVRLKARSDSKPISQAPTSMIRANSESRIQLSMTNLVVVVTVYGICFGLVGAFPESEASNTSLVWLPWLSVPLVAMLLAMLPRNILILAMITGYASALACMIAKQGHPKGSFLFAFYTTAQSVCIFSPLTAFWLPKLAKIQQAD